MTKLWPAIIVLSLGSALAAQQPIPSSSEGALDAPENWDCRKIRPEYTDWLEAGNPASGWKFVGKTYRDAETGETYDWQDWLEWAEDAGCLPGNAQSNIATGPGKAFYIGSAVNAVGAGIIAATRGRGPKSPG